MNLAQVARILAGFTLFFSLIQAIPLALAFFADGESGRTVPIDAKRGFIVSIGAGLLTSLLFWTAGRGAKGAMFRKEGLIVVAAAWFVACLLGAIPFSSSGALENVADAVFESVSGLTTTGASVLGATGETPTIESLPRSLLFWRSFMQWLGGLGIILVFIVLLPAMGVTGKNLLSSEQIGVSNEALRPRMQAQARSLFKLYVVFTLAAMLAYWSIEMEFFDAMCHAFTTLATAGFSTKNASLGHYDNVGLEVATIFFMFLAGVNFALLLSAVKNGFKKPLVVFKNVEFRLYLGLTVTLVFLATLVLWSSGEDGFGTSLRCAAFSIVSILTSTGYGTDNFQTWPAMGLFLIMVCMFVGGSSGSTSGGFKVVRVLVVFKVITYQLRHFIRPKSVEKIRVGRDVVPNSITAGILAMLLLWLTSVTVGAIVLSFDERLHVFDCLAMSISMNSCTGPALSAVDSTGALVNAGGIDVGPHGSYGHLESWSKFVLAFQMILGRLEFLVPLALLTPSFWKR